MKSVPPNRILAIAGILILLGILVAVTPWYIFPVCEVKGTSDDSMADMKMGSDSSMATSPGTHMKCWYTAEAETGVGALIILMGILLIVLPSRISEKVTGILSVILGIVTISIPTFVIGVCNSPSAPCRIGTLPALILLGFLTVIAGMYLLYKTVKDPAVPN